MTPSLRSDHVFAIVRYDAFDGLDVPVENRVTVKKIVLSAQEAEAEVARLNSVNQGKGCHYFFQVTRIDRGALDQVALPANQESTQAAQV